MNHIEAMKLALDHSEPSILSPGWTLVRNEDIAALRSALSEQPAQQEPVAWLVECSGESALVRHTENFPGVFSGNEFNKRPLVFGDTSPPAQRKPLTDERQIAEALRRHGLTLVKTAKGYDVMSLGHITAHGIKENT